MAIDVRTHIGSFLTPARRGFARAGLIGALALVAAVGAVVALPAPAPAAIPEPEPVPRRWELDFKPGPLRYTTVEVEGQGTRGYLYMTYRVANNSKEDVLFAPIFELSTLEGDLVRSGTDVAPEVTKAIAAKLDNTLLQDQISILGTLQQGEASAREGLVVWALPKVEMASASVYVAGLSGETQTVEVLDPKTKEVRRVSLRKTRMIRFNMPGNVTKQGNAPFEVAEDRWIMR